jgi:hypothetical protein
MGGDRRFDCFIVGIERPRQAGHIEAIWENPSWR